MKHILITGITGFAGSFLAENIIENQKDTEVIGTYISDNSLENIVTIKEKIHTEKVDLTNNEAVDSLVAKSRPNIVYHLAAITSVVEGFEDPAAVIANNATAQLHLLDALRKYGMSKTKVIIISSANVYGKVHPEDLPINETTPLRPDNPYAVSKITQDFIGLQYFLAYNMQLVRLRPFNHLGPRLSPHISISYFAQQIANIEKGKQEAVLKVGNLKAKRDFTDVRDMVRAYVIAAQKGVAGDVYNIGTGIAYSIGELLNTLLSMTKAKIEIVVDKSRMRPSDIEELRCDTNKFTQLTGWKPEITLEQTLQDTLEYWRNIS